MNNAASLIIALTVLGAGGYLIFKKREEGAASFAANTPDVILNPSGSGTQYTPSNNTPTTPPPTVNPQIMAIVTQLRNGLVSWFSGSARCDAYKKYYETSTNDFLLIWNLYKNQYGTTIREDMDATYQSGCSIFTTQWDEKIYQRFNALGI